MPKLRTGHAFVAVLLLLAMLVQGTWALAGTTGRISGTLTDLTTGNPVANARITAASPSQSASTTTDAGGRFNFLNLAPDTYVVSAAKSGYQAASQAGITVFADQSITVTLSTRPQLRTIANVTSRAAGNLVKPGTTSDVYSVNAATQQVVSGSGGGFNLNQAYSGIYSQPGVTSYIGNYGWGQVFYIRGSAYSQIGYEFDGVPVNRAFDNYQANSLSSLGQQELQVYTGGSPSGASSATLGGFINQVIKSGTYPGFGTLTAQIGSPGFFHGLTAEAGGATPNRNFSYYAGLMGYNAHFPYGSWSNLSNVSSSGMSSYGAFAPFEESNLVGALFGITNVGAPDAGSWPFQYTNGPWPACSVTNGEPKGYSAANPGPYNGACLGFGPYNPGYLSDMYERDNVLNFHFAIPHKNDSGRDDIQLLYDNSMQLQPDASSFYDLGGMQLENGFYQPFAQYSSPDYTGPFTGLCGERNQLSATPCVNGGTPFAYTDGYIFAPGTSFGQSVASAKIVPYYFPNSPQNRPLNYGINPGLRDANWNDVGIVKGQYTKNISSNAYARLFAYSFYSDWLISGPDAGATAYVNGLELPGHFGNTPDYELDTHSRGAEFQWADQINAQHLLQFTANYTTANVARFNNSTWRDTTSGTYSGVTNLTNGNPNNPECFDPATGALASCFSAKGTYTSPTGANTSADPCATGELAPATPACQAGARWLVTTPGGQGTYNLVKPKFSSAALTDEFKPNDRLDLNLGVRFENYTYDLSNTNTPEFNFWFNAEAQLLCYDPATGQPMFTPLAPGQPTPPNPISTAPYGACGKAPSGQEGLHPVGHTCPPGGVDCGPIKYSAVRAELVQPQRVVAAHRRHVHALTRHRIAFLRRQVHAADRNGIRAIHRSVRKAGRELRLQPLLGLGLPYARARQPGPVLDQLRLFNRAAFPQYRLDGESFAVLPRHAQPDRFARSRPGIRFGSERRTSAQLRR